MYVLVVIICGILTICGWALQKWWRAPVVTAVRSARLWVLWIAAALVVAWYYFTDPDRGAETVMRLQLMAWLVVCAGPAYLLRRALMDRARSRAAFLKSLEHPIGAGLSFLGLCILTGLIFFAFSLRAQAADTLPPGARTHLPALAEELHDFWPDLHLRSVIAAQVEQESCISLRNKRCWQPTAELKTSREYGFGFVQTTVAYRADGSERFNRWREDRDQFPAELANWTWDRRFDARMQLRAGILGNRSCYRRLQQMSQADEYNALAMCDAAHNGGYDAMLGERRMCAASPGCNPNLWFRNVELYSAKSRVKLRGYGQSWFDINRGHVRNVMLMQPRRHKYAIWFREVV